MTKEEMEIHRAAAERMIVVGIDILTIIEVIEEKQNDRRKQG